VKGRPPIAPQIESLKDRMAILENRVAAAQKAIEELRASRIDMLVQPIDLPEESYVQRFKVWPDGR
jgi:hypothetical protein